MKLVARIVMLGLGLYLLLKLNLLVIIMALLIKTGQVILIIGKEHPEAAAVGVLLLITMAGKNLINKEQEDHHRRRY